ncbi:trans-2-enoyl-CoA reductase (NADPH) TSC13 [Aspergillus clavatus NRRL 1]|uniref:very-long-chain enoyl-CoA reductase n=1 Tax=Aspergillus clavatus (strain ATCC 1007 / CBS 513.65 / DSM 816 / NCTC 3887 / NRRL 1 / QM 1276 / 107) TaxID=344612 RepID=A1CI16_ASPCL|nr:steroid alpha reductase family protein [Aspergillus clavatus NRRL 1]EAW10521.1 steroid alpha reductase family protein [Aspergillus clavatus NRRL 1]
MASTTITLVVQPRGKPIRKLPKELQIGPNATTQEIYDALANASGFSVHRLRITKGSDRTVVPNSKATSVDDIGLKNQSVVHVKDLGPQIAWRTVFIIEYLGPLLIPALFLFPLRPYIYYNFDQPLPEPSDLQLLVCGLLSIHFAKRELETIFIHRFSNATMPARNIFKNSAHYWVLAGFNIAYWVFRPDASAATSKPNLALLYSGLALFVFGELANLNTHLVLRGLRRPGTTERGIPSGFGFNLVTCPNYLFEIIAWLGVYLVSGLSWSVLLFIAVGGAQMASWAAKKERRYRKEFGDKYKRKRSVLLPGIF